MTDSEVQAIVSGSPVATSANILDSGATIRVTKRKLEEAFHTLDSAVGSSESLIERRPPPKRQHVARSLYSTLAKYGIKPKDTKTTQMNSVIGLSKPTPHLTAILNRVASRTRHALPFKFSAPSTATNTPQPVHYGVDYRPSSTASFISRLATFKLTTYANKPPAIDASAAAKCGWINDGKDRLVCSICHVSWVVIGKEGMTRDAANALIEKQRISLVEQHKNGCPWKAKQCDDSIYCITLNTPAAMARNIKSNAISLHPVLDGFQIKHPLTPAQLNSLLSAISRVDLPSYSLSEESPSEPDGIAEPSEIAVLAALFGWAIVQPAADQKQPSSRSRMASVHSSPSTPSISRSSSVQPLRSSTPTSGPSTFRPTPCIASDNAVNRDTALLHCSLCQRNVGLWAFAPPPQVPHLAVNDSTCPSSDTSTEASRSQLQANRSPQRQLDLLKEHRSYCPYVVRSTTVPSLSTSVPQPDSRANGQPRLSSSLSQLNIHKSEMEGWRAVLTVVLRYGLSQRGGLRHAASEGVPTDDLANGQDVTEADEVEAMVAGVKRKGGRELLRYVKGLLS